MKKFNIIRYLKRWWPLIALMSIFAGAFFMRYASNNQAYTAQAVIKYTYDAASEGLTPNGEPLDVSEIFSSTVVKEAIERLGYSVNVDTIRSGGTVTGITPADVQTRQDALAEKGEEVEEYYPTEYVVKLTVGSSRSAEFARLMLDEILSCYFASFGEKYVDYSTIPNNAENVLAGGYDYIEQAEILSNSVDEIIAQLGSRQSAAPDFTSSRTGLSVSDLFDEYSYIQSVRIPYLFSEILGERLTQNREILLKKYQERYANYMLTSGTDGDKVASVKEVIESYGNKNKEGSLYYAGTNGTDTNGQNGFVLGDVYEEYDANGNIKDRTTVYDTLISDYVTLLNRKSDSLIDAAYCQYIIDTFSKAPNATENTAEARASVEAEISALQTRLDDLYQVLLVTMEEYNEYMGAVNVGVLSTTAVSARVNVKLYMMLGVVVFIIRGV